MAKVINDVVKMDWEKSGWYQLPANRGKKQVFIFASQEYESELYDDPVTVFFTPFCAFVMETDEGLWNAKDFSAIDISILTGYGYPTNIEGVIPIIDGGECSDEVLERFGLTQYKKDIVARREDVRGFADETDIDPSSM